MADNCKMVVFSDKAYNAIIRETFEWDPVETGGILLGHILDNGCWIVMEVLPPGYSEGREGDNVHHEMGYFEYNQRFVNYLANSVATQYKIPLELLGLWHRHPGSMNYFSTTDDGTNRTFASLNPNGAISGLVNVDPKLHMTMYYIRHNDTGLGRPSYQTVDVEVGSDLIPEEYFEMQYYGGAGDDLHPLAPRRHRQQNPQSSSARQYHTGGNINESNGIDIGKILENQLGQTKESQQSDNDINPNENSSRWNNKIDEVFGKIKNNKLIFFPLIAVVFVLFVCMFWHGVKSVFWPNNDKKEEPRQEVVYEHHETTINLIDDKITLSDFSPQQIKIEPPVYSTINWQSSNPSIVTVDEHGQIRAVTNGEATIKAFYGKQILESHITVQILEPNIEIPDVEIDNGRYSESCSLTLNQSHQLGLKCEDSNFDLHQLVWKSKDASIVQVDENGKLTAMAEGTTDVCICFDENVLDSIKITVKHKKQ